MNVYDGAAKNPLKSCQEPAVAGFWLVTSQMDKLEVLPCGLSMMERPKNCWKDGRWIFGCSVIDRQHDKDLQHHYCHIY